MQSTESAALPPLDKIGSAHAAYVRRLLTRFRIYPTHAREDLLQEILLEAHRSRGSCLAPPALLSGITSHVFFRWHERQRRGAAALGRYAASLADHEVQRSAEDDFQEAERVQAIRASLQSLPAKLRWLFEAVEIEGRPVSVVAGGGGNTDQHRIYAAPQRA